jgi:hypothetical protein
MVTGGTAPGGWLAPTDVERRLYEAKLRGDWAAFFDVLAGTYLYWPVSRAEAEAGRTPHAPFRSPVTGTWCFAYYTEGVLPVPQPDPVFQPRTFSYVVRTWGNDNRWLAINPGTPGEAYFPATPQTLHLWRQHAERISPAECGTLRTLRVGGPLQGAVAHGLGCGALFAVKNGELWNALAFHGSGFVDERNSLEKWWGVKSPEEWRETLHSLLNAEYVSRVWEFALSIRQSLARQYGGSVDTPMWREAAAHVMRRNAEPETVPESAVNGVQQLIGRITRYEARFRADGLLAEGRHVRSVLAWDYGRAVSMARWGVAARFGDVPEAEAAVLRAGQAAQVAYRSWEDFGAGFVLGRCLHFDEEEFGPWYREAAEAYKVLTSHPESPWLTLPWR